MPHKRRRQRLAYDADAYLERLGNDLDANATMIGPLFGEVDPFYKGTRRGELIETLDYIEWCIGETENPWVRQESIFQLSEVYFLLRAPFYQHEYASRLAYNPWLPVKDGDPRLLMVFRDHYSYREPADGKPHSKLVVGPGYKLPLIIPNERDPLHGRPQAIWAWRLERHRQDRDYGACCAFFRNESSHYKASELIRAAEDHAMVRWPYIPRFFTHIDTTKVKPMRRRHKHGKGHTNIWGASYQRAGWRVLPDRTQSGLLRLEKLFRPPGWDDLLLHRGRFATTVNCPGRAWPFPERIYERNPGNGAEPPWRPQTPRERPQGGQAAGKPGNAT